MRATTAALALVLALAVGAPAARAQDDAPAERAEKQGQDAAEALFKELSAEVNAATKKAADAYRAAWAAEQKAAQEEGREPVRPAWDMTAVNAPFVERFQKAADEYAGTDAAVQFLMWLLRGGGEDGKRAAIDTLLSDHLDGAAIGQFLQWMPYLTADIGEDTARDTLDSVIADNPHVEMKATALLSRGELHRKAEDIDAARADFKQAVELGKGLKVGARAAGVINEMDNLHIGKVAPDIVGEDLDGVAFKLSDYRGQVLVLDFWGDW